MSRGLDAPLNADQQRAEAEILESIKARRSHTLIGEGGAGKTFLTLKVALKLQKRRLSVILAAPTHAAVAVQKRKLREAGIDGIQCSTIQSVLSLKPKPFGDKLVFERSKNAEPIIADVIFADECSMIGEDLMRHIELHTPNTTVVFTGDDHQLNPVGERSSRTFDIPHQSLLTTNERQRAGNPLLAAAHLLRESQGGAVDWSWVQAAQQKPYGVYVPSPENVDPALRRAFLSSDYKADTDNYVYLAWTNQRVADINDRVRYWLYGEVDTPFVPGEKALTRQPVMIDDDIAINNNAETTVERIEAGEAEIELPKQRNAPEWRQSVPVWKMRISTEESGPVDVQMVRDVGAYNNLLARIKAEAAHERKRWDCFHKVKDQFAVLQAMYARTIHCSQGMTVRNCFLDIPEMRRWTKMDRLEGQRGSYVGLTRPTDAAILCGVAA